MDEKLSEEDKAFQQEIKDFLSDHVKCSMDEITKHFLGVTQKEVNVYNTKITRLRGFLGKLLYEGKIEWSFDHKYSLKETTNGN